MVRAIRVGSLGSGTFLPGLQNYSLAWDQDGGILDMGRDEVHKQITKERGQYSAILAKQA